MTSVSVGPKRIKLALLAASPVHFKAPFYRRLAADPHLDFTAIFASSGGIRPVDGGYGRRVLLDASVVGGYRALFLKRADRNPTENDEPGFFAYRDFDVVHVLLSGQYDVLWLWGYNYLTHQLAALSQRLSGKPIIFGDDQTMLHSRPFWKRAVKKVGLRLMLAGVYSHYVGTNNRMFLNHYGIKADRLHFTPYAVDNDRLRAAATQLKHLKGALRQEFRIDAAAGPIILSVGRLVPKKQPLFVLEAFRRVRAQRRCTLLIVGSGVLEDELRNRIARENIPDVVMAGFLNQEQLPRAYAAADIFVIGSKIHETWGVVVNEAMNFGLPIIASDKVGSAIDLVRPDRNGFIVSAEDPAAMAKRMLDLLSDQGLRDRFGEASLDIVADWNFQRSVEGMIEALQHAVGKDRWDLAYKSDTRVGEEAQA